VRDLLAGGAIALFGYYLFRWVTLRLRFRRGIRAESRAVELARRKGYRIVGTQVPGTVTVIVDGRPRVLDVRADMLLERGFRRFIAEVKTGRIAPDPTSSATRRQLLEYAHAFDADGLLLFDMEKERIHEIRFAGRTSWGRVLERIAGAAILIGAGAILEWSAHVIATVAPRP
jgi:hypothetical protein